jgi:hypothetical protein
MKTSRNCLLYVAIFVSVAVDQLCSTFNEATLLLAAERLINLTLFNVSGIVTLYQRELRRSRDIDDPKVALKVSCVGIINLEYTVCVCVCVCKWYIFWIDSTLQSIFWSFSKIRD